MKTYRASKNDSGTLDVVVDDGTQTYLLPLRLDLANKSPTGFQSGYAGSGPAQLALALLADALGDDRKALRLMQDFKFRVVGRLPREGWELSQEEIRQTVAQLEAERGRRR
jgi:hypothetical protein